MFDFFKKKKLNLPPVPKWKPTIAQPLDKIADIFKYYTDGKCDFALFENGTCAVLASGLLESEAEESAKEILKNIFHAHPDMNPIMMDDGNILVQYNQPAANVVLKEMVQAHWAEIDRNHQKGLATSEVFITPMGQNVFDDFGKKALFGRCFMFMDAQNPKVIKIVRKSI